MSCACTDLCGGRPAMAVPTAIPQTIQDAYSLINARIGLRASDDRWEVNLFGRNLTDEGYCVSTFEQPFGAQLGAVNATTNTTVQRCAVGEPLTWGVQLKLRN